MRDPVLTAARLSFFKKIPQPREFNDVVRRQNRANHIRLRHGVNFIQMTLRFGLQQRLRSCRCSACDAWRRPWRCGGLRVSTRG
jgi:hypothetical protein